MMEYKGYVADSEYDDIADGLPILNRIPLQRFGQRFVEERLLESEFRLSVDVYLESCAEDGVEPLPPLPVARKSEDGASVAQPAVSAGDSD